MIKKPNFVISNEDLKLLLWLPHKTGTRTVQFIFNHFDFKTVIENTQDKTKLTHNYITGINTTDLPDNHLDYQLISTMRNPYSRFISYHFFSNKLNPKKQIDLYDYNSSIGRISKFLDIEPMAFGKRTPDFFIKTESMLEDVLQFDFIQQSKLYQCGVLQDLVSKKFNSTSYNENWKNYYNRELADQVYNLFKHIFDLNIYDKDSWK